MTIEALLILIENEVLVHESNLYKTLDELKNSLLINEQDLIFSKLELITRFLSKIYLSFSDDIKTLLDQRIGKKDSLVNLLNKLDRIDDIYERRTIIKEIKDGTFLKIQ